MDTLNFQRFDDARLAELMTWFPDEIALKTWGGGEFRFPFTETTFREDTKLGSLPTWMLTEHGRFVAFGQCYLRAGRCHFGRLAVSPAARGRGIGSRLIRELAQWGKREFQADSCSLFVMPGNRDALRLYRRMGFSELPYPEASPETDGYTYMVARGL